MSGPPRFSVVVPMRDEAASVAGLAGEIAAACTPAGPFEAIFVDDGSTDGTSAAIALARTRFPWLRALRHPAPRGQSASIRSGVLAARAPVICTIDGDGQNPPAEIPRLVGPLLGPAPCPGLVAGQRRRRRSSPARRLASRLANRIRAAVLGDGVRDGACGLKAFPRELFLRLPQFDHMHRYLPALVRAEGLPVLLVEVDDRPRQAGRSKYTIPGRALAGLIDLPCVWWLIRRRRRIEARTDIESANPSSKKLRAPDSSDRLSRSQAVCAEAARDNDRRGRQSTGKEET